jgi:hypothetical protein
MWLHACSQKCNIFVSHVLTSACNTSNLHGFTLSTVSRARGLSEGLTDSVLNVPWHKVSTSVQIAVNNIPCAGDLREPPNCRHFARKLFLEPRSETNVSQLSLKVFLLTQSSKTHGHSHCNQPSLTHTIASRGIPVNLWRETWMLGHCWEQFLLQYVTGVRHSNPINCTLIYVQPVQ